MNKQKLDEVIGEGVVVLFDSKIDFICYLKEIKSYGVRLLNGEEIVIPKEKYIQYYFRVYVEKDYKISFVSGICFHNRALPSTNYAKIK